MADVDAILAGKTYTDRKGRMWHRCPSPPDEMDDGWWAYGRPIPGRFEYVSGATMRTLIERDLHRDDCPGLLSCLAHPVPFVWWGSLTGNWYAVPAGARLGLSHPTLTAALDAARHTTGETR